MINLIIRVCIYEYFLMSVYKGWLIHEGIMREYKRFQDIFLDIIKDFR